MQALRTMRILWFALTLSVVAIACAHLFALPRMPPPRDNTIAIALSGLAFVVAVMSFVLPRFLFRRPSARRLGGGDRNEDAVNDLRAKIVRFQTPFILSMALSEAVALFGMVLGRLGYPDTIVLPFFGAGIALVLIRFPTMSSFD